MNYTATSLYFIKVCSLFSSFYLPLLFPFIFQLHRNCIHAFIFDYFLSSIVEKLAKACEFPPCTEQKWEKLISKISFGNFFAARFYTHNNGYSKYMQASLSPIKLQRIHRTNAWNCIASLKYRLWKESLQDCICVCVFLCFLVKFIKQIEWKKKRKKKTTSFHYIR